MGSVGYLHSFLTLHCGSEWSVSRARRFIPGETIPIIHWTSGWMGPRASLDSSERRKMPRSYRHFYATSLILVV